MASRAACARASTISEQRVAVKAAFGPSEARRSAFAEAYGFRTADSAHAIFADPSIDAVLLLTPPNTHLDFVRQAAAAGKHVLPGKAAGHQPRPRRTTRRRRGKGRHKARHRPAAPLPPDQPSPSRPSSAKVASATSSALGPPLQLAAAKLLRPARTRHESATAAATLLTQASPHARPDDLARRPAGRSHRLCRHQPGPPHGDRRPRLCRAEIRQWRHRRDQRHHRRPGPGIPDAVDIIGTQGHGPHRGRAVDRASTTARRRSPTTARSAAAPAPTPWLSPPAPPRRDRGFPRGHRAQAATLRSPAARP